MVSRVDLIIAGVLLAIGLVGGGFIGARLQSIFGGLTNPFADIQAPSLPNIFNIFQGPPEGVPLTPAGGGGINPADQPTAPTPIDVAISEGATVEDIAAMIGIDPLDPNQDPTKFQPPSQDVPQTPVPEGPEIISPFGINVGPFLVLDEPSFIGPPTPMPEPTSQLNIGGFQGEAISAPLGALPLSQIIEQFMVTASQAANIKFIAQQGGDPFAEPSNIFGENPPAVSDPMFQGLSLSEIAAQIGQPISNF